MTSTTYWPGGTREEGETIRDCVARELREELDQADAEPGAERVPVAVDVVRLAGAAEFVRSDDLGPGAVRANRRYEGIKGPGS